MAVSAGPTVAIPNDIVRVFVSSGTFTPSFTGTVEVLVVGGGGAGGGGIGGGGGGGGVVYMPAVSVTASTAYTITVGAGGAAIVYSSISGSGGDSTAFGATAKGGGGSGVHDSGDGVSGGSGGGAASNNSRINQGGATTGNSLGSNAGTIYGNRGGNMTTARVGGPTAAAGGGGAGAAAADTNSNTVQTSSGNANGRGGAGVVNGILGVPYYWAGGGGGGAYYNGYAGDGGIGGGGAGSCTAGSGPSIGGGLALSSGSNAPTDGNGGSGGVNTGGGGGGGAWQVTSGGAGGSGIVIIRYSSSLGTSTGGGTISLGDMSLCVDAANPHSNIGNRSIINWNSWTTGSGSVAGYGQNGTTVENERVVASNPWGNNAVVWEARASGDSEGDGGWNTDWFNIDNTQMYRFSVWVRRTSSSSGGNFYLGMYANGDGSRLTSNNTVETNAYWECSGTGGLVQNTWYLWVGHVYPANTLFTGRNPNTGYYTINGRAGNINGCNIGSGDLKWSLNSTQGLHRTYLFYATDTTTRLQFYQPRVDLCDGSEPSIQDLINNAGNTWNDVSGNSNNLKFFNLPSTNTGFYTFNGTSNYGTVSSIQTFGNNTTWEAWVNCTENISTYNMFMGRYLPYFSFFGANRLYFSNYVNGVQQTIQTASNLSTNTWYLATFTTSFDGTNTTMKIYTNGVETATGTFTGAQSNYTGFNFMVGDGNDGSNGASLWYPFKGSVSNVKMYSRTLTADEILQNFNAYRGRYGV